MLFVINFIYKINVTVQPLLSYTFLLYFFGGLLNGIIDMFLQLKIDFFVQSLRKNL